MLNSYHLNDKFPTDVQPVYVTICMIPGFFQDLWRTIGDAIFVCIVTSRVYFTSMEFTLIWPMNFPISKGKFIDQTDHITSIYDLCQYLSADISFFVLPVWFIQKAHMICV